MDRNPVSSNQQKAFVIKLKGQLKHAFLKKWLLFKAYVDAIPYLPFYIYFKQKIYSMETVQLLRHAKIKDFLDPRPPSRFVIIFSIF